ncbi:MAG: CopG family transcriptional regulator [Colwellia sp.]|nr:CopG family transcriptional regulator [Colwellia sp.]
MTQLSKRSTVYFDPSIHHALKLKAVTTHLSVSELINEALKLFMREDQEDLNAFSERANEPEISYEELLNDLKEHGKI